MIAVLRVSYFTLHWNDDKQLTKSSLGAKFSEFFVLFGTQLKALCISENFSFYTLRSSVCMAVMIIMLWYLHTSYYLLPSGIHQDKLTK